MEEDSNRNSTALTPYRADDDGWNSPIVPSEGGGRQIQGTLLTFVDKQWFAGTGKFKEEVPIGTQLIAVAFRQGWKRWKDGVVVDFVTEIDGHYPRRNELGYLDEREWECGPDDKPGDPWQDSREIVLVDPKTFAEYTFCTATKGGRGEVDRLKGSVETARRFRPGKLPIVCLEWKRMSTDYGMKSKPFLRIVDWFPPDCAPNDLNDKIGF
jgi:hypothetical protein